MSEVQEATLRARRLYRSKGFRGAYVAGARAAVNGRSEESCPYSSEATWARTWRRAWLRGFKSI